MWDTTLRHSFSVVSWISNFHSGFIVDECLSTEYVRLLRLWVVSNSGDGDCGTGDIHARARNFRRRVVEGDFCAHTCISPELCISPASNANDLGL